MATSETALTTASVTTRRNLQQMLSTVDFDRTSLRRAPLEYADWTVRAGADVAPHSWPGKIEARNGFLNFSMSDGQLQSALNAALEQNERYGASQALAGQRMLVEFVSADPTGPLPFSLARIAASGDALCRLLAFAGADVTREWYLNDVENSSKLRLLGESVAAAYGARFGETSRAEGALDDAWIQRIAHSLEQDNRWLLAPESERIAHFAHAARDAAVASQRATLDQFGVRFDVWTSEAALRAQGRVDSVVQRLRERGHTFERDGATWLRASQFGAETDHVLLRRDGNPTYLAGDIAYHAFKLERGFARVVNVWTAEHRPYIERTRAALNALGVDADKVEFLLCEGARWRRDGKTVLQGREGSDWTLDEALEESDAATLRYWLLRAPWGESVTVEAERALRDDETNTAYAVRLLPARLATRRRETEARASEKQDWSDGERTIVRLVALWPDVAENAALDRAPWRVTTWLEELAAAVRQNVSQSSENGAGARTLQAAQIAASNALRALGVTPDETF
jgi:arginyl-tRNA synthetase